jgi:hypothetical protein
VVDRVEASVVTVVWVKERQNVNSIEVSQWALQKFFDVAKVATDALGINQDAGTRH